MHMTGECVRQAGSQGGADRPELGAKGCGLAPGRGTPRGAVHSARGHSYEGRGHSNEKERQLDTGMQVGQESSVAGRKGEGVGGRKPGGGVTKEDQGARGSQRIGGMGGAGTQ